MAAFIEKDDFVGVIRENILDDITELDDDFLEKTNQRAVDMMKGYLTNRYDIEAIFNATGSDRNPTVLMYAMDISLYLLHKSSNPRKVPANRYSSYKDAMEWLKGVNALEINPDLPIILNDQGTDDKAYVQYGSNQKRNNHI